MKDVFDKYGFVDATASVIDWEYIRDPVDLEYHQHKLDTEIRHALKQIHDLEYNE